MSHLSCRIIRVKGEKVEIVIEEQIISVPKKYFPSVSEKDQFSLFIFSSKYPNLNEKHLAKSILEEILNGR